MRSLVRSWRVVLTTALLLGAVAPTARAGPRMRTWEAALIDDATTHWPVSIKGNVIFTLPAAAEGRIDEGEGILAAAEEEKLTPDKVKLLTGCLEELKEFGKALAACLPVLERASGAAAQMDTTEREAVVKLRKLVRDVSGKKPAVVEDAFDALQRDTKSTEDASAKDLEAVENALQKGTAWRAKMPFFGPTDVALDDRAQQVTHALQDTFDRVFKEAKGVQAAKQGADGVLCELCLSGDTEEALAYLQSWQPPRIVHATDLRDVFAFPAESGWIDVVAHGSATSMTLKIRGGKTMKADAETVFAALKHTLKAEELANWRRLNDDLNVGFRLISCETGASPTGIAQELANLTGVQVKAPTEVLWLLRKGGQVLGIIHSCPLCRTAPRTPYLYDHVVGSTERGTWKVFSPAGSEVDEKIRDLLLAMAKVKPWWQVSVTDVKLTKKPAETVKALQRLGAKQKDDVLEALLAGGKDFVLLDAVTRDQAISKAGEAARLGLKCRGEVMPRYKDYFKDVKTD